MKEKIFGKELHAMTYPFILPPLPYPPAALEPNLGRSSVRLHHDAFFAAYADRLNGALAPWPQYQDWPLERLLLHWCQLPRALGQAVRRYGGGTYNHTLYFSSLAPARTTKPSPALLAEIEHSFGSMEGLHRSMKNAAASIFGSGWVWLVCCSGGLQIVCTANQDTPLPLWPLVNMDLWEHAFLPDYENRRDDYMEAALAIIDWDAASRRSLVRSEMLYHIRWIFQFCFEKLGIHRNILVQRNPHQVFFAAAFHETLADRRKGIKHFHIEEKRNFVNQLVPIGRRIAIEIVFVHKAETINFHLNACFFKHFTDNGLLCCFTEFYPAANGVEIVSVIANHQNLSVLHDDCADTDIQNSIVTGYAHIFVHCFSTLSPFCYFKTYFHALLS